MSEISFGEEKKFSRSQIIGMIICLVAVILIAVISAVIVKESDSEPHIEVSDAKTKTVQFNLDPGTVYSHALTDNKLFFFSVDSLKIASFEGVVEEDTVLKASNPIISTDGNYALIADKGGKTAHIFSGSKLEKTLTLDENIIIAKINSNGYCLFITEGEVHKNSAIVRSSTGEEVFKWKSGSLSVSAADISDNNRDIAVSTISTDGGTVSSNIYLFNITKDKPFTNDSIGDEIFGVLQFEGNYMYALGAAKTYVYNSYGKCIENIDYEDRELIGYDIDDSMVALLFNDSSQYSNGSKVCSYNTRGSLQGEFIMESKARFVDCKNNNIAVDNNRVVSILDSRCHEKFQLNIGTALSDFQYAGNATRAIGITATGADIIEVRNRG